MGCAESQVSFRLPRAKITYKESSPNLTSSSFSGDPEAAKAPRHKISSETTSSNISRPEISYVRKKKKEGNSHKPSITIFQRENSYRPNWSSGSSKMLSKPTGTDGICLMGSPETRKTGKNSRNSFLRMLWCEI